MTHEDEALEHEFGSQYEDLSDPERYETATDDWQSPEQRKFRKLLDDYRKKHPEEFCRASMLTTKPARRWQQDRETRDTPKTELFGPMWRTGELAVLFGESGAGKSILAVQIAESIARGRAAMENGKWRMENSGNSSLSTFHSPLSVLYLDLAHTDQQFDERYSCPSPIPGKLALRYRFSPKLRRASFGDLEIPEAFRGDRRRYLRHSLDLALHETRAAVLIIDDLSWFDTGSSRGSSAIRTLRDLKLRCAKSGLSILVLDNSPTQTFRTPHSPLRNQGLQIPRSASRIYEIADTVFAIGRPVTYAEDIRYIKPLKVRTVSSGWTKSSPPYEGGVAAASADGVVLRAGDVLTYHLERSAGFVKNGSDSDGASSNSSASSKSALVTRHSSLSATPFVGLKYLGVSPESDLLRDYAAEAEARHAAEANRLKRIRDPKHVVDMLTSREYQRYLKGE